MRKLQFATENYYHVYNRGTDKRIIFSDTDDYLRFIHYLYECNDITKPDLKLTRKIVRGLASDNSRARDILVQIVVFSLMPNHFHLLLKQVKEDGVAKFMQKLGTGYTMYFNKKNDRSGSLFQGTFKAKAVESDEYLVHLSRYVHINSVELIEPGWKKDGIMDWEQTNEFLEKYRWSSYPDYIGIRNFPSVIDKGAMSSLFQNDRSYKQFVNQFLSKDLEFIKDILLE